MKGTWALITGASSGFGRALAEMLAERGVNLILTARREDRLQKLREELLAKHAQRNVQIENLVFDVRDWRQCEAALKQKGCSGGEGFDPHQQRRIRADWNRWPKEARKIGIK